MIQSRSISVDDPSAACPVSPETLGRLLRAQPDAIAQMTDELSEAERARLAVYLYGRSHTHELGLRIAATCEGAALRRAAGLVGNTLYEQSRKPYTAPTHGTAQSGSKRKISLGGARLSS
ncbi:hypothetical protein OPKNFCMD_6705 [Methylobacterium crusticola]|uniref:Uncharacterized protein n=1 Tax=Methylobacterium crusticola TaxID=1697972 RepID=A0ABQ4R878_9HYPH|nr:hypothetical protein [Methylobacterium crusticola]GJD53926.1 hypothetical protein OPKNFCMD_6705 [Methylobacterium crusticola]